VPPTARADTFSTGTYAQKEFDVLANDSAGSAALNPSSLTITSGPAHANNYEVRSDFTIRYRSVLLFIGTDSLQYRICDTAGRCATATVTFKVGLL